MKRPKDHRRWVRAAFLAAAPFAAHAGLPAQTNAAAADPGTQGLIEKAHTLESRGRLDMAAQTWQQVLLADPSNAEALGGLARAAKTSGNDKLAGLYLDRLRASSPSDPAIARAEAIPTDAARAGELARAAKLAGSGQPGQAMEIYHRVYGTEPPPGDAALAFYTTEAATDEGRAPAIAGLRALAQKSPSDSRYPVALGRILTDNPKTRGEGRRLLERYPSNPDAVEALRRGLLFDRNDPAAAPEIRAFLARHPDEELASALRNVPSPTQAAPGSSTREGGGASAGRSAEEAAGYRALNAHRPEEAEGHFKTALAERPDSAESLVGMGYVRMAQGNFAGALNFLIQGRQNGSHDRGLDSALATSRFWHTMEEGAAASNANDLPLAERQYRAALALRPGSPEALEGLGGTLLKANQPAAAVPVFAQFAKVKPSAAHAWRGLLLARTGSGDTIGALAAESAIPAAVRPELERDPVYLRALASAYLAAGRDTDAQRVLKSALDLPFPTDAKGVETGTELDYAALLGQANRLDQAAGLYREVLARENDNVAAWQGLVRVQHAAGADLEATRTLESMPPAVFAHAMRDVGFAGTVAGVYSGAKRLDLAQEILEKSVAGERAAGEKVPSALRLQLADVYMQRGAPDRAFKLFTEVIAEDPSRPDAWRGLLATLHTAGRDREALAEVGQIPPATRAALENDVDFLQTIGSVYAALGQAGQAKIFLERVQMHYALAHSRPPAETEVQGAWLLYNSHDDAGLYRQLLSLGDRGDLTDAQRRTAQTIWANWAVRRANQTAAAGNTARAIAILNATARTFPDNPGAIKALADGYARAGLPKQAVLIWKAQDLSAAPATDYRGAVGAALAAGDMKAAETWLRFALNGYPRDPAILLLGAKFEEARGDTRRAADYYRASLDAMPPHDPGAELAAELSRSAPAGDDPLPASRGAVRASESDLASLLAPGADGGVAGNMAAPPPAQPYLPSSQNLTGLPPVVLPPASPPGLSAPGNGPGAAPAVPSYMVPKTPLPAYPSSGGGGGSTHLRDYVPQAALDEPLPPEATRLPVFADAGSSGPGIKATGNEPVPAVLGRSGPLSEQPTLEASARQTPVGRTPQLRASLEVPPLASPGAPAQEGEVFGPYVPYHAPAPAAAAPPAHLSVAKTVEHGHGSPRAIPTAPAVPRHLPGARAGESRPPAEVYTTPLPPAQTLAADTDGRATSPTAADSSTPSIVAAVHTPGAGDSAAGFEPAVAPAQNAAANQSAGSNPGFAQQYPQPLSARPLTRRRAHPSGARPKGQTAADGVTASPGSPTAAPPEAPAMPGLSYPGVGQPLTYQPYPTLGEPYLLGAPPSDFDLEAKNVPPLRGRYAASAPPPLTQRQQAERDLASLEGSYSAWIGGTGGARYRSGTAGLDRLTDVETTFEASASVGKAARLSVVPRAVFLNSGSLNNTVYGGSTTAIPVLGTYPANAAIAPAQQFVNGVGGELQLAGRNFALAAGYTPYEFLVENVTARAVFQPNRHITFYGSREPVTDTELSYAGLRDPGQGSAVFGGPIWGGVVASGGGLRFDLGDERAGFYVSADGADLTGYHVLENNKVEGAAGVYFLAHSFPRVGRLNVGASLFGMHFAHNERGLTYGLGGYFSPSAYFVASVPITFTGHYGDRFHYTAAGNFGVQTFQEDAASFFPLDRGIESGYCLPGSPAAAVAGCGRYPTNSNTGGNYGINTEGAYRVAEHWYAGGFLSANNTNNYNTVTGGFFVRYVFRPQYGTEGYPTGLFPVDGFRPLRVP